MQVFKKTRNLSKWNKKTLVNLSLRNYYIYIYILIGISYNTSKNVGHVPLFRNSFKARRLEISHTFHKHATKWVFSKFLQ